MSASSSATRTRCGFASSVVAPVMDAIVAVVARVSDLGGSSMVESRALVSQLAEETDSKPVQCEFESHRGHRCVRGRSCRLAGLNRQDLGALNGRPFNASPQTPVPVAQTAKLFSVMPLHRGPIR